MAKFESKYTNTFYSMLWFFLITTIFFVIKFKSEKNYIPSLSTAKNKNQKGIYLIVYILFVIIGQYFINVYITKNVCGTAQWGTATKITIVPWVIIFITLCSLLLIFPGWLSPFSNTFGYAIAIVSGLNKLINTILKPSTEYSSSNSDIKSLQESLALIYENKSLIINEITKENFDDFWKRITPLMKPNISEDKDKKSELYKLIVLKNIVAEYIWYILTGFLVCSVGYNYLVESKCKDKDDIMIEMKNTNKILTNMKNINN